MKFGVLWMVGRVLYSEDRGFINSALSTLQEIDGLVVIEGNLLSKGMGESGVHTKNH
jgi:hypothetical protein